MRVLLGLSVIFNIVLAIAFLYKGRAETPRMPAPPQLAATEPALPAPKVTAIAVTPAAESNLPSYVTGKGEGCETVWQSITEIAARVTPDLEADVRDTDALKGLSADVKCKFPAPLADAHKELFTACQEAPPDLGEGMPIIPNLHCLFAAKRYQSALVDWQTAGTPLGQITDRRVLAHKLMVAENSSHAGGAPRVAAEVIAGRMLELEPANIDIVKLYLEVGGESLRTAPETRERAIASIEKVAETHPNDRDLEDRWFELKSMSPEPLGDEALDKFAKMFPRSGLALYAKAGRALDNDNREDAAKWIKAALAKDPRDMRLVRFADALQRGERPFTELGLPPGGLNPALMVDRERLAR